MGTSSRIFTIFAIFIGICILCAGSGYIGYNYSQYQAKVDEADFNYVQGHNEGEKIGYKKFRSINPGVDIFVAARIRVYDAGHRIALAQRNYCYIVVDEVQKSGAFQKQVETAIGNAGVHSRISARLQVWIPNPVGPFSFQSKIALPRIRYPDGVP